MIILCLSTAAAAAAAAWPLMTPIAIVSSSYCHLPPRCFIATDRLPAFVCDHNRRLYENCIVPAGTSVFMLPVNVTSCIFELNTGS